jgi:hypothetical protein
LHSRISVILAFLLPAAAFAHGGHGGHPHYSAGTAHHHAGSVVVAHAHPRPHVASVHSSTRPTSRPGTKRPPHPKDKAKNFQTCLSGTSATKCDHSLLSPREAEEVRAAELRKARENPTPDVQKPAPSTTSHHEGHGYINSKGEWVPSPRWTENGKPPSGASAQCSDGSYSFSRSRRGTCSHHGGVARWL